MNEYLSLLTQIPLVGIFVFFTLEIIKRQNKTNEQRDEQWREFLKAQTERQNLGLARIADEVKENTAILRELKNG